MAKKDTMRSGSVFSGKTPKVKNANIIKDKPRSGSVFDNTSTNKVIKGGGYGSKPPNNPPRPPAGAVKPVKPVKVVKVRSSVKSTHRIAGRGR